MSLTTAEDAVKQDVKIVETDITHTVGTATADIVKTYSGNIVLIALAAGLIIGAIVGHFVL